MKNILIITNFAEKNELISATANRRDRYTVIALPKDSVLATAQLAIELHSNLINGDFYDYVVLIDSAQGGYTCKLGDFAVPRCIVADDRTYDIPNTLRMSQSVYPITADLNELRNEQGNVLLMRNVVAIAKLCDNYEYDLHVIARIDELPQYHEKSESHKSLTCAIDYLESLN